MTSHMPMPHPHPVSLQSRYHGIIQDRRVAADPDLQYCTRPGCTTILRKSGAAMAGGVLILTCPTCGQVDDVARQSAAEDARRREMLMYVYVYAVVGVGCLP